MSDYKDSLNLPKTNFPMKANLAQREPALIKKWQEQDIYQQLRTHCEGREKFVFNDGPPYANGPIHLGHATNKILKDTVLKFKTLSNYDTPMIPGWDCHGLPIELNVEKKHGKAGVKLSHREFREACRKYAKQQMQGQRDAFIRLGVIADWQNPYLTMDYDFEANVIRTLGKIIAKDHIHRGYKPVHWCVDCGSALAEAEVEYIDKRSPAIDVRFAVLDDAAFLARCHSVPEKGLDGRPISVVIWTTTPWTLPANQGVALHKDLEYALVDTGDNTGYVLIAEALIKDVMGRYEKNNYRVVAYCQGKDLEGLHLQHPFYDREVPIILGHHVTVENGTGAVHIAPGHGQEDYIVGLEYKLPVDHQVKANGCFQEDTKLFANLHVFKANQHVIEELKARGNLLHEESLEHSYPHCWRHKTPLIFRGTPQWFISMDKKGLREKTLEEIKKVKWIPAWGEGRITDMVSKRPDWCISRQRAWGVPIALFVHKDDGHLHPKTPELIEQVAKLVEQSGVEAWYEIDIKSMLGDDAENYIQCQDTLDVWFDSGAVYACILEAREGREVPADLYLEGSDQHRGWFQTSLLSCVATKDCAPYKQVLTHGFTVDAKGHKMSKSLGNVVSPDQIIKTLGADILRLWVAATDYRGEISFSDEILKRISDTYRRIRNTARFLLSNLHGFDPAKDSIADSELLPLEKWAIDSARLTQEKIIKAYDEYQFHVVVQDIHHFCAMDMGSFYLDIIKDRQYTCQTDSLARRSAQTAMYHILEALVRWLAPILSFTAEEIWQNMPGKRVDSVFFSTWYTDLLELGDSASFNQNFWNTVRQARDAVNKELERNRNENIIGSALEANVTLYCDQNWLDILSQLEDENRFVFITSELKLVPLESAPATAVESEITGLKIQVEKSSHEKCERCWHRRETVGQDNTHPTLCDRCITNIDGDGEVRHYA